MREWGWLGWGGEGHVFIVPKWTVERAAIAGGGGQFAYWNNPKLSTRRHFFPRNVNRKNKSVSEKKLVGKFRICKVISVDRPATLRLAADWERNIWKYFWNRLVWSWEVESARKMGSSIACHRRQAPRRLKQGKISRACSTNGRKEKLNRQFWWQMNHSKVVA